MGDRRSPFFVNFGPLGLRELIPEAQTALTDLSELPFAVRVIADHAPLFTDERDFDVMEDVGEILIGLARHVIPHVLQAAPDQPSLVAVHVFRRPGSADLGLARCIYWWYPDGRPGGGGSERYLHEASCSYCHPELTGADERTE